MSLIFFKKDLISISLEFNTLRFIFTAQIFNEGRVAQG